MALANLFAAMACSLPAGAVTASLPISPVAVSAFLSYWSLATWTGMTGLGRVLVPVAPVFGLVWVTVLVPVLEYQPCLPADRLPVPGSPVSGPGCPATACWRTSSVGLTGIVTVTVWEPFSWFSSLTLMRLFAYVYS